MSTQLPMEQHSREPEFLASAARLTMVSRLGGALAHEFRNPLTTIFVHADILADALRRLESNQRLQLLHFLPTKAGKLGLGLYVAHAIVTAPDGVIEVCSTPGAGATVRLTFSACPGSGPL